jgi:two-component system, sensor histidine kinase
VEDNSINASLIKAQLEDCCETDMAADGKTAIEKTSKRNYDIILMDINLGSGMDGIQTTQEIRKLPGYEDTPIVAVTGYALPSDKEKFLSSGLSHFLPKPFTQEDLVKLIRSIYIKN